MLRRQNSKSLSEVISGRPELSNLTVYLNTLPQFLEQLSQLSNVTFLAPNNDAFADFLNSSAGSALATGGDSNQALVEALLSYHVLNGTYNFTASTDTQFIQTALQPPQFANVTGGQTVEVVPGSDGETDFYSGLLDMSSTTQQEREYEGGALYSVKKFLTIPQNFSDTSVQANLTATVGAATKADLLNTLDQESDLTIFVPDNDAWASIGSVIGDWSTENLTNIMQYHVVKGRVMYSPSLTTASVTTLNGANISLTTTDTGSSWINSAQVTTPNILIANGVMHVIGGVLNPDNTTVTIGGTSQVMFEGAGSGSLDALTSGVPTPTGDINPTTDASATSSATDASSSDTANPTPSNGLSGGAIAGIVVGVVGGLLVLGAVLWIWRRERRSNPSTKPKGGAVRAELSAAEKTELATNANRHEADGKPLPASNTGPAELPGDDVRPVKKDTSETTGS